MKIKMLTNSVGHSDDDRSSGGVVVREAGKEYEVDEAEALRLLESEQAEPVAERPSERAEKRGPGRPRKTPLQAPRVA